MALQTIELKVRDRRLSFVEGGMREYYLVSHNAGYQMKFDLDETLDSPTAVFVRNSKRIKECDIDDEGYVLDENGDRGISAEALTFPIAFVGVEANEYATTYVPICVHCSIKDLYTEDDSPSGDESSWGETSSIVPEVVDEHMILNVTDLDDVSFSTINEHLVADLTFAKGLNFSIKNERLVATI